MPFPMLPEKGKFKSDAYKTYQERNNGRIDLAQKKVEEYLENKKTKGFLRLHGISFQTL